MAKKFKSKKIIRKLFLLKYLFLILFIYLVIKCCIYSLSRISPSSYYYPKILFIDYLNLIKDNTINSPTNLLDYHINSIEEEKIDLVVDIKDTEIDSSSKLEEEKVIKKIYIYNSHQSEKYSDNKSVMDAAKYMKEVFKNYDIEVMVEEGSIQDFLIANNYSYNYSYVASRYFIEEELSKNDYDLIIDLHRDAVSRNSSLVTINKKKYAKVMFVIGKKNKNYKYNYKLASDLNDLIKKKYPTLTRGILLQSGKNVNGIYNQDLDKKILLIELGGNKNTFQEVKNTIDIIVPIIGEYLYEETI